MKKFLKSDFNIHSTYSPYVFHSIEDMVIQSIKRVNKVIGFNDNNPLTDYSNRMSRDDIDLYINELIRVQNKYKDRIKIFKGLEIDYFKELDEDIRKYKTMFDYISLGVHFFDYKENMKIEDVWDIKNITDVRRYQEKILEGLSTGLFDMLCHPDIFLRNFKRWSNTLEKISRSIINKAIEFNVIIEFNCHEFRTCYESYFEENLCNVKFQFWNLVKKSKAKVIINSDSTNIAHIKNKDVLQALDYCNDIGIEVEEVIK